MRFTSDEVTKILSDLDAVVKRGDHPSVLLCNWLRDHQNEAIHIYPESLVMDLKEHNPLWKEQH